MRKFTTKHYLAAGVTAVAITAAAGTAFAYWSSTGSGSGSLTTGSDTHFAVSVGAPSGSALTPGGPTDTVSVTVTNNGSGYQNLSAATASVANSNGSAWTAVTGCSADDFTVSAVTIPTGEIAPGGHVTGSFTIQMVDNTTASQDGCKTANVPLYVAVS